MKSKAKKLNGTAMQVEVEMPKEMVDKAYSEVLEDIKKSVTIPGFRQGKAPIEMIRNQYKEDAEDQVKQKLVPIGYQHALEEHGIDPASYPEVTDINLSLAGTLTFKAKVDRHPEVTAKKYKGLKLSTEAVSVKDDEVEEAFTRIRNMSAEFADVDKELEKGDFAICAVETFMGGESISKKRENMWIEVDKEASLLGVGEELTGMKKGEAKDIEVTLPEGYPDKKYAGKQAVFHVEIKETKEKKLPELNDEFAKKMGKENIEEVKEDLRTQLLERKENNAKINMKNQIMEQLLKDNSFEVPETMVKRQQKVLMERAEAELAEKGIDEKTIEEHKKELAGQLAKEAENKVRLYFILDEIGAREEIGVEDAEVDGWLNTLATSYNQPFDQVKKYYEEHDLLGGVKEQLKEEKTLELLLAEANISKK